jgi:uncharacterized SAM-binding protein YcdF (DUF218 family)
LHSTYENAVDAARLPRPEGIRTLVPASERYHVPMALACFRREGLAVLPAVCGTDPPTPAFMHGDWGL